MDIEYTFENQCNPFIETYECRLATPPDFSKTPLLEQLITILKDQHVDTKRIDQVFYYNERKQQWIPAMNGPVDGGSFTDRVKLRVVLKDCKAEVEARIREQIQELQSEIRSLRDVVLQLKSPQLATVGTAAPIAAPEEAKFQNIDLGGVLTLNRHSSNDALAPADKLNMFKSSSLMTMPTLATSPSGIQKRETDISYLYAVPIVKIEKKQAYSLGNPIDACKEIESIVGEMRADNKDVLIRINVGTFDRLRNALAMRPKVLHISCHGGYEMEEGVPKLYLYLENNDLNGVVEKYDVDTFRQQFEAEIKNAKEIRPRLVFVSACYSQKVGEAIKQAGIPNVIAVNSDTQVADEAATRFAKVLYHYLTLGLTVSEAFEQTKADGRVNMRKLKLCCCTHIHKETCPQLDAIIKNREEAHAKHVPECNCEFGGNIHYRNCKWAKQMAELSYESRPLEDNPKKVRVCCCSPELPHNEEEKFVLIPPVKDEKIFDNLLDAEPTVYRCFDCQTLPRTDDLLVGRNIELHKVITYLVSPSYEHKIVAVMGPKGIGKGLLAKVAAKYVIERGFFPDGTVTISLSSLTWHLSAFNSALLPPPYKEARNLVELGQKLRAVQKLVILQCYDVIETNPYELIKILKAILSEAPRMKFLIQAKSSLKNQYVAEVEIAENLDPLSAYTIIKRKSPELSLTYSRFEGTELARILVAPWLAKKAAYLLKSFSAEDVYFQLCKEASIPQTGRPSNLDPNSTYDSYVKSSEDLFVQIKAKCEDMTPFYVLAQAPSGLLESELQTLCEEEFGRWKEKVSEFISETSSPQTIVAVARMEEVKENKYKLLDAALRYINEYLLDAAERSRYRIICLERMATSARKIVYSFNVNSYKCLKYNEFSAIINEGIWAEPYTDRQGGSKTIPQDPISRFQISKDNYMYYMDPGMLAKILSEMTNVDVEVYKTLRILKELALCTFTMLLHLERPHNAMHAAECIQGFAVTQLESHGYENNRKIYKCLRDIAGLMQLMMGAMALRETDVIGPRDAQRQAEAAGASFKSSGNDVGMGEALYLQALISVVEPETRKYALVGFKDAKDRFPLKSYSIGVVRVNIAMAAFLLEGDGTDTTESEKLLDEALEILSNKEYFDNMEAECFYYKAMCAEKHKDYNLIREHLLSSLGKCRFIGNKALESKCITKLNYASTCMQQDYPLFSFLKSYPLVRSSDMPGESWQALEPYVRKQSFFRQILTDNFENKRMAIKTHFETLTRDSLKQSLLRSCVAMHVSSDYYEAGTINLEGEVAELDQIPLEEFKKMLADPIRTSQCKVVTIVIPMGEEIAQAFVDLGVQHVIYYNFRSSNLAAYQDKIPLGMIHNAANEKFCTEFYKNIISGDTVFTAVSNARKSMVQEVESRVEQLGIKEFVLTMEEGPVLLPLDVTGTIHDVKVLPTLKTGKYIETSPKRGVCDIEKERKVLIDRQLEMFNIAKALSSNICVNLYGRRGVGKTKLAKEVAYFLNVRSWFLSGIYYRNDMQQIHNPKYFVPMEEGREKKDEYSALFIVDNLDASVWKKEAHFFQSLREDRKYVFLFISQERLDAIPDFEIQAMRLKPFMDNISIEYVMSYIDHSKFTVGSQIFKNSQTRAGLRDNIMCSQGFRQAHGYPKLLEIFCDMMLETANVADINLLKDQRVDASFKRIIRHYENAPTRFDVPVLEHLRSQQFGAKQRPYGADSRFMIPSMKRVDEEPLVTSSSIMNPRASLYMRPLFPQEPAEIQIQNMRTNFSKQNSLRIEDMTASQAATLRNEQREALFKHPSFELEPEREPIMESAVEQEKIRPHKLFQAFGRAISTPTSCMVNPEDLQNAKSEIMMPVPELKRDESSGGATETLAIPTGTMTAAQTLDESQIVPLSLSQVQHLADQAQDAMSEKAEEEEKKEQESESESDSDFEDEEEKAEDETKDKALLQPRRKSGIDERFKARKSTKGRGSGLRKSFFKRRKRGSNRQINPEAIAQTQSCILTAASFAGKSDKV